VNSQAVTYTVRAACKRCRTRRGKGTPPYVDTRNALNFEVQGSGLAFRDVGTQGKEIEEALNQHVVEYDEFEETEHWGRGCGGSYFLHPK